MAYCNRRHHRVNVVVRRHNGTLIEYTIDGVPQPLAPTAKFNPRRKESRDWPLALKSLKLLAQPGDRGLGDIITRTIGPLGGDAFKTWHLKIFGRSCGCDVRQESWNARYPLESKQNQAA